MNYHIISLFLSLILIFVSVLLVVPMVIAFLTGAPWVPTNRFSINKMIDAAELKKGDIVMDPGCGDGRILFSALRSNKEVKARGYEMFFAPYIFAKIKSLFVKNVDIWFKDSRKADMSDVNTMFCYMMPDSLIKLGANWKKKLPSNAQVISYAFQIGGWKLHKKIDKVPRKNQAAIYIYRLQDQN